jgi:hypothetical protein
MTQKEGKITVRVSTSLKRILPQFIGLQKKNLVDIKLAFEKKDMVQVQKIGHVMHGSCGGYDFTDLGAIGKEIEINSINENMAEIKVSIDKFEYYMNHFEIEFYEDD